VVARLREAGAVLIGKQNLHEIGKGGTIDFLFGQPRNPWNPAYDASSSSTGSGIATAAGMCAFSIGEDTCGSIRGPASCNGIVGLRPTFGRVSRHGGVMHAWTTDTFGPLARTVQDCAAVLQVICGHDPADPFSRCDQIPDFGFGITGDVRGLRLGLVSEIIYGEGVDPEVKADILGACDLFAREGAIVENVLLPLAKWAVPLQLLSADADVASWSLATYLRDRDARCEAGTRTPLAASSLIPESVYNRAMRACVLVCRQVLGALEQYDALLTPTNVTPPRPIEDAKETVTADPDNRVRRLIRRRM
jgi:Asp-tRNA(Asn)/Glu-tRNA(Gln) amidotransferase A subunit family amidase